MSVLHICNTFFEQELEAPLSWPPTHPIHLQLQFLPLLYAAPDDQILVSHLPPNPDPRLCLNPTPSPIEHWGPSRAIAAWAKNHSLPYAIPDWDLVRRINSKAFSFSNTPQLPGSALLATPAETLAWIAKTPGPKVLKTPFGTAGRGHFHVGQKDPAPFLKRQFDRGFPVIGEPWVERLLDFSTQWHLGPRPQLLGATLFENDPHGTYRSTLAGAPLAPFEWALQDHLAIAHPLLAQIASLGYRGNLGIDAFVYRWQGQERLHPIVEINGRKTMNWVALQLQRQRCPDRPLRLIFEPGQGGVLPQEIAVGDKTTVFPRRLVVES